MGVTYQRQWVRAAEGRLRTVVACLERDVDVMLECRLSAALSDLQGSETFLHRSLDAGLMLRKSCSSLESVEFRILVYI